MTSELSVTLNVGGKVFKTSRETLLNYPDSLLGRLVLENTTTLTTTNDNKKGDKPKPLELSFDRNPQMVPSLLDFYRSGELHIPSYLCSTVVATELDFWGVPCRLIRECCWKKFDGDCSDVSITEEIDAYFKDKFVSDEAKAAGRLSLSARIWLTLEDSSYSPLAKLWTLVYYSVVFFSVLIFSLASVDDFREVRDEFQKMNTKGGGSVGAYSPIFANATSTKFANVTSLKFANATSPKVTNATSSEVASATGMNQPKPPPPDGSAKEKYFMTEPVPWLYYGEMACYVFFFLELSVRLLVCPIKKRFFTQFKNAVDLFLLTHYVILLVIKATFNTDATDDVSRTENTFLLTFHSLGMVRMFRLIYFAREFDETKIMALVASVSKVYLLQLVVCVMSFVGLFGSLVYVVELVSQDFSDTFLDSPFVTIPAGMWWSIVTITTVGYGDMYPVSVAGQLVGAVCTLSGVIVLAAPITLLGGRYCDYQRNLSAQKQKKSIKEFVRDNPKWSEKKAVSGPRASISSTKTKFKPIDRPLDPGVEKRVKPVRSRSKIEPLGNNTALVLSNIEDNKNNPYL